MYLNLNAFAVFVFLGKKQFSAISCQKWRFPDRKSLKIVFSCPEIAENCFFLPGNR